MEDHPNELAGSIRIKDECSEMVIEQMEPSLLDDNDVRMVVLQNVERGDQTIPIILNHYNQQDSDGNLHTETIEDSEVIETYYINQADSYAHLNNHELIFEGSDSSVHYIIEDHSNYDETIHTLGHLDDRIEYIYEDSSPMFAQSQEAAELKMRLVDDEGVDGEETIELLGEEVSPKGEEGEETEVATEEEEEVDDPQVETEEEEEEEEPVIERIKVEDVESEYKCDLCSKAFRSSGGLKRHITVIHGDKETAKDPLTLELCLCCGEPSDSAHTIGDFSCDQCTKVFQQENFLNRHRCLEHPEEDEYKCSECKKPFDTKEEIAEHMKCHLAKSVRCPDCNREFSRKYHLERHIGESACMGAPTKAYDCHVCKRFFTRKDNLAEHLRVHAGQTKKKKMFKCQYCVKEFQGSTLLNIHERTHTGEKPYNCDLCPKAFPSRAAMKKHRRMHTGEKPYSCEMCGRTFAAKETLNRHWRTHTGEKPHVCQFCGKAFIQPTQLRAHIFHHTGENAYKCPHCNRAFNRKLRLTTHIKFIHDGAEPLPCPHCDKSFFRKEDVQRHMLCHSGEKPYACGECDKRFSVKSSLKAHILTHKKEAPCNCDTCGRPFIRRDCLMRHIRAKHRDVLEDILANAEKRRLQQQLLHAATDAASKSSLTGTVVWNELTLTESIKELLTLLVDEECLEEFGYPDTPVDKVLDSVIKKCGHDPVSEEDFDYLGRMRENAKLLFTVVIDDDAVKELLNNQTVDEVIMHVLKLARSQSS